MLLNKEVSLCDIFPLIEEQLENGGSASFTVHGTSMEPLLKDRRDGVRIARCKQPPKKYDIIFYRRDNGDFILHRIVGIGKDGLVCRGDNQLEKEYPVKHESIIGTVTHYSKKGKTKDIDCFSQRIYARIWVNFPFLCRLHWKFGG